MGVDLTNFAARLQIAFFIRYLKILYSNFPCRAGIGHLTIVDGDVVDLSNKNRQVWTYFADVDSRLYV